VIPARITISPDGFTFRAPVNPLAGSAFFGFVLALCVGGCVSAFTHPHRADDASEKVALLLIVLVVGWVLYRCARSAFLSASRSGVVVRTLFRTYRWEWEELGSFEEVVRPVGVSGVPRRLIRVHFNSGRVRNLTELNASKRQDPDPVAEVVARLEQLRTLARAG